MDGTDDQEIRGVYRGFLFFRLALLCPFFVIVGDATCPTGLIASLVALLLTMGLIPLAVYFFRPAWTKRRETFAALAGLDFILISLLSLLYSRQAGMPVFWILYFLIAAELAWWWSWPGALIAGAGGGAVLSWLYMTHTNLQSHQGLAMIAMTFGWPIVIGYFVQQLVKQRQERRHMARWLVEQEDLVRHVQNRFLGWQEACLSLQQADSPQSLLQAALKEAIDSTASAVGMIVLNDHQRGTPRAECWSGFALPNSYKITLRIGDQLPTADQGGGLLEVRHVLESVLRASIARESGNEAIDLGRIVVARTFGSPYGEVEAQWLQILAGYTGALLENNLLRGQIGRIQAETDSIGVAARTLAALPDPAAAMEMACRNILNTMHLHEVAIFLYGESDEPGCNVIVYPGNGPTRTIAAPLQGRGLRLLRKFLDIGTPLIANRRSDCLEVFELMDWGTEVQAVACFPLDALQHRWGALCLLATSADSFPPQTQQHLSIFSGEVAMALENSYLRQVTAGATV